MTCRCLNAARAKRRWRWLPFYQLDNPGRNRDQGLGLGLSIVKRLADLVNSPLQLQSEPGKGSVFS